jgi:3-oxoacyl-[acyl-carrier protein] reductase
MNANAISFLGGAIDMEGFNLKGSRLTIFGGGSGIGLAVAALASTAGAKVTIADISEEVTSLPIVNSGACRFIKCSVIDPAAVAFTLREVIRQDDGIDAVITTVGGATIRHELGTDIDYWTRDLAANLTSAYIVATAAIAEMRAGGRGNIVMTASTFAFSPGADRVAYAAAKAGVIGLTRSLAVATAKLGLRINCVAPGLTDTPRVRAMSRSADDFERAAAAKPQGHIASTDDVANSILFLASDAARSITGQVLHVNNGSYMP